MGMTTYDYLKYLKHRSMVDVCVLRIHLDLAVPQLCGSWIR